MTWSNNRLPNRAPNITLVCSAHRANGACNTEELLKILRAIEPNVVFGEFQLSNFDFLYEQGFLEQLTIKRFCDLKSFQLVGVDRVDVPDSLMEEMQRVFEYVDQPGQEYYALKEKEDAYTNRYGFRFLNSIDHEILTGKLREIEDRTIAGCSDQGYIRALEMWRRITLRREFGMVRDIYEYSRSHVFDAGVFLVGASHKKGIVREIEKRITAEPSLITWNLAYGQNL